MSMGKMLVECYRYSWPMYKERRYAKFGVSFVSKRGRRIEEKEAGIESFNPFTIEKV